MCWFAAKTKRRAEFKAHEFFSSTGVNSYVPSFKTRRIWSDRVKNVIVPAISGYVFFELDKMDFNTLNNWKRRVDVPTVELCNSIVDPYQSAVW